MQCPVDQTELVMTERQGVEIDYCPKCRGVWLDRGELDKIIERSGELTAPRSQSVTASTSGQRETYGQRPDSYRGDRDRYDDDDDEYTVDKHGRRKKKRGSFLDDLFDF